MGLTRSEYNQISKVYEERQMRDHRTLELHKKTAMERIPALRDLENEILDLSMETYRSMQSGNHQALAEMRKKVEAATARRKTLLKEHGLPEDYLEPVYECPDCHDKGYIEGPNGREKCHCYREMEMQFLYRQSGVSTIVRAENFDTFDLSVYDDGTMVGPNTSNLQYMRNVRDHLIDWCRRFPDNPEKERNLLFRGDPGTGKTFLLNCIAKAVMDRYHSVIYLTSIDLFESLSYKKNKEEDETDEMLEAILDCELLIIDDLGTEMNNTFTSSKLFYILNQRIVYQRSTIISTNLKHDQLRDSYGERTASRLNGSFDRYALFGTDIRNRRKNGR